MNSSKFWKRALGAGLLLLSVSGLSCTKTPLQVQYHTLNPIARKAHSQVKSLPPILVGPVRVSSFLDQGPLVEQNSAYSASLLEQHHWAGDLDEILSRLIIQNLSLDLDSEKIYSYPESSVYEGIRLDVHFFHFEKDAEGNAVLEARWRIMQNKDQTILQSATTNLRITPEDPGYDALAVGLSQGVARLCHEMADTAIKFHTDGRLKP